MSEERASDGKFLPGHVNLSPGRPRRAIELDYARILADALSLDAWRTIVDRAVSDAQDGDSKAREWLSNRILADGALNLMQMAVCDQLAITSTDKIDMAVEGAMDGADSAFGPSNQVEHIIKARHVREREARDAQIASDAAEARAARKALKIASG